MPEFILAYHGNGKKPDSPEEATEGMQKWQQWAADLGDNMINPGTPLGMSKTVTVSGVEDNGGANPLSGFSVVKAENMDAALGIAKSCPFIEMEQGTIEVAEFMQI